MSPLSPKCSFLTVALVALAVCCFVGSAKAQSADPKMAVRGLKADAGKSGAPIEIAAPGEGESPHTWDDRFGYGKPGALNGWASVVSATDDGRVFVGGQFTRAGAAASANRVAVWDGSQWSSLGEGVDGSVSAIYVRGGDVYIGGDFSLAGGVAAKNIARWDGAAWHAVGPGLPGTVTDIEFYNDELHVSGWFERAAGNDLASYIARWDGNAWRSLAAGVDDWVTSMAVYQGKLVVAGLFRSANGYSGTQGVAAWDGTRWSSLGQGMDDLVMTVAADGSDLYAGGAFTSASGVAGTQHVARWDGRAWNALGNGLDDWASSIDVKDGMVAVGGWFKSALGTQASTTVRRVALWDISEKVWKTVGEGVSYTVDKETAVLSVAQWDGDVFLAGVFNQAGSRSSIGFGRYIGEAPAVETSPKLVAPKNFDNVAGTSVELVWESVPGAISYTVQISKDESFASPLVLTSGSTSRAFNQAEAGEEYYWRVRAEFAYESGSWSETMSFTRVINTSLDGGLLPGEFRLDQNYPNPFNPGTTIRYELGETAPVVLAVYSVDGRKVATLVEGVQNAGAHHVAFDASSLSSGVYVYRLQTPKSVLTRTMTLVK